MAILTKPASNEAFGLFDLSNEEMPPQGTYAATIINVVDRMGVERTKFQSKETETVDLTAFLFGFQGNDGKRYKIDTRPMKISGHPKAALYKFLTALLGHAPAYGWDYAELKGSRCLLTVAHMTSESGTVYAAITAAVPLPAGFGAPAAASAPAVPPPPPEFRIADDDGEVPF